MTLKIAFAAAVLLASLQPASSRPIPERGPYVARCEAKLFPVNAKRKAEGKKAFSDAEWKKTCDGDYDALVSINAGRSRQILPFSCFPITDLELCRQARRNMR